MNKTDSPLVNSRAFGDYFTVSGTLWNHCHSLHKTGSRQYAWILTVSDRSPLTGDLFRAQLKPHDLPTSVGVSSSKIPTHLAGNEHFLLPIPQFFPPRPGDLNHLNCYEQNIQILLSLDVPSRRLVASLCYWSLITMELTEMPLYGWSKCCTWNDCTTSGRVHLTSDSNPVSIFKITRSWRKEAIVCMEFGRPLTSRSLVTTQSNIAKLQIQQCKHVISW